MHQPDRRPVTPSDVVAYSVVSSVRISPDGRDVAFVVHDSFNERGKLAKGRIWLVSSEGGAAREFTSGPRSDGAPRWSPDGQTLAFLSDRSEDGRLQLYLLARAGGEARQLFDAKGDLGVGRRADALQWSPDGTRLAFLMKDPDVEDERRRKDQGDDAIEVEHAPKFARLYVVDVAGGEIRPLSPANAQIWEFDWSPDGNDFVVLASDSPEEWSWYHARIARLPLGGGDLTTLYTSHRQIARPIWSPDCQHIAFVSSVFSDRGVIGGDLQVMPSGGGAALNLTEGMPCSPSWATWRADGRSLLVLAHEDGGSSIFEIDLATRARRDLWVGQVSFGEASWPRFDEARDGSLAVVREDLGNPRDVWVGRRVAETIAWQQLTRVNPGLSEIEVGPVASIRWNARDGRSIQGFLITPPGDVAGGALPLVTWVHGGPTSAYNARFYGLHWANLLASQGIAVLLPNPRGSVGWGRAFAEANVGDMGGEDFEDILAGIDHLVASGRVDPSRLGIGGWSYGGFMTTWAVTQTARFRAAIVGAGICDWRSFHGTSHLSAWDALHYAADPYERGGTFERFSPLTHVQQVHTPTLILHGENDHDVPVTQSQQLFRALKELGVETQLVVYPREGHGVSEKSHVLDLNRRIVAWFAARL
ncbi:MAG TPA: S9 family peptidase [Chloroflexota bacterium]|nr:S9 family peptidase [Chloroflexota bacterium]